MHSIARLCGHNPALAIREVLSGYRFAVGILENILDPPPEKRAYPEGVPGYVITVDLGLMAPAGTPPDVVAKLNTAARKVMDRAEQRQRLQSLGYEIFHDGPPSGLAAFIQADITKWVPLVQRSGAKVD
jgi:hypothetical protein